MVHPAPAEPAADPRYTSDRYFALVTEGVLSPDDRVELLEGVIVSMSPHNPRHSAGVRLASATLYHAVGDAAVVQVQLSLVAGPYSVPEPDLAVLPGKQADYYTAHPRTALLVVEVADTSLKQDRITKAAIYAAAGIPEFWLVNLRDHQVEVFRAPLTSERRYTEMTIAHRGESIALVALPAVAVAVDDLLPG